VSGESYPWQSQFTRVSSSVVALLLAAGSGIAQVDPGVDMIGIYLDEGATVHCADAPVGEQVTAFLCLTNSTALAGLAGWEAAIEVAGDLTVLDWNLRAEAVNVSVPPVFTVGLAECLPWSPAIVALDFTLDVIGPDRSELKVAPHPGHEVPPPCPLPLFAACGGAGEVQTLGFSGGADPLTCEPHVCAVINGECDVVGRSAPTWDTVKSMFR